MIYIKFINYIVNFITIQPEPTTSKNQDIEENNKPPGLKNFPYHQQGINKVRTCTLNYAIGIFCVTAMTSMAFGVSIRNM